MASRSGMKFSILLCTPVSHPSVETVVGLFEAALQREIDVYLYLIDEGVKNVRDPRLVTLSEKGMKLFACAYGCQKHEVSTANLEPHVSLCGLVALSNTIEACDRLLTSSSTNHLLRKGEAPSAIVASGYGCSGARETSYVYGNTN